MFTKFISENSSYIGLSYTCRQKRYTVIFLLTSTLFILELQNNVQIINCMGNIFQCLVPDNIAKQHFLTLEQK